MNSKSQRIIAAKETLNIFDNGYYIVNNKKINISEAHKHSLCSTTLYTPNILNELHLNNEENNKPIYKLLSQPVVTCLRNISNEGYSNIGILNFASAKNPGGGFLNGALAQEESLAMCSNLYLTQIKNNTYYEENRNFKSTLYTDHMIFSRDVVFIRENCESLWETPIIVSVLTSPAVNMGAYLKNNNADLENANLVMKNRMRKILEVFANENISTIILGAFGCGVFKNDPNIVARYFYELLKDEKYKKYFEKIVFSIFDTSKTQNVYNAFENVFKNILLGDLHG